MAVLKVAPLKMLPPKLTIIESLQRNRSGWLSTAFRNPPTVARLPLKYAVPVNAEAILGFAQISLRFSYRNPAFLKKRPDVQGRRIISYISRIAVMIFSDFSLSMLPSASM